MRVIFARDFSEEDLFALAHHYGESRKLIAREVKAWIETLVATSLEDLHYDYEQSKAKEK
jgi:hypothetical protein